MIRPFPRLMEPIPFEGDRLFFWGHPNKKGFQKLFRRLSYFHPYNKKMKSFFKEIKESNSKPV
jgi:hypothetical protein